MPITPERATKLKESLKPFGDEIDFEQGRFELSTDSRRGNGFLPLATH